MDNGALVRPAGRTWRWWGVLRLALVLLWLAAATVTWWTAPREQTYEQARSDVAAGRVTAFRWGDRWDGNVLRSWSRAWTLESSGTLGPLFVWRTSDGRVHWTNTDNFGQVTTTTGAADEQTYSGAGALAIAQDLRTAGLEDRGGDVDTPEPLVVGIGGVLAVLFLGVLVAGPAPVRGTRWFWFWVVYFVPLGLGLLFWLIRDRPWSRSAAPDFAPDGGQRRDRGFLGFGIGMLSAMAVSLLLLILHNLLGDRWVPNP